MLAFHKIFNTFLLLGVGCMLISIIFNGNELYEMISSPDMMGYGEVGSIESVYSRLIVKSTIMGLVLISLIVLLVLRKTRGDAVELSSSQLDHATQGKKAVAIREDTNLTQKNGILDLDKWEETFTNDSDLSYDANFVLSSLSGLFKASQGVMYLKSSGNKLETVARYACANLEQESEQEVEFGDGLVGEVAQINKHIYLKNIPDDTEEIVSGLGCASPSGLLLFPLTHKGKVIGVVELSLFHQINESALNDIERISGFLEEPTYDLMKSHFS